MTAYSRIQQQEFAREKNDQTGVKQQKKVVISYFDAVSNTISNSQSLTNAMTRSIESKHFQKNNLPIYFYSSPLRGYFLFVNVLKILL